MQCLYLASRVHGQALALYRPASWGLKDQLRLWNVASSQYFVMTQSPVRFTMQFPACLAVFNR
jgi:hypothetical protein